MPTFHDPPILTRRRTWTVLPSPGSPFTVFDVTEFDTPPLSKRFDPPTLVPTNNRYFSTDASFGTQVKVSLMSSLN